MQWSDFVGHTLQIDWFRTALRQGRLATSFLFVGPEGIGKRTFARLLAASLLCQRARPADLSPCGSCEDCAQVAASTHPDLLQVAKPSDKAFIPIELLIGERDKRMREGLCHDISLRPYAGRRKIAILDDADTLNQEGANCLLKTLEEPPTDSILILIGTSLQRQLPTIRSRCQAIIFRPLAVDNLVTLILREGLVETRDAAEELARLSAGSLHEARVMADPEIREFRESLFEALSKSALPLVKLPKLCAGLADAAGKDARAKRDRLKLAFRLSAKLYRGVALTQFGQAEPLGDDPLQHAVRRLCTQWLGDAHTATACWQRCLLAIEQVDRNANQAGLLEAWSADLAQLSGC